MVGVLINVKCFIFDNLLESMSLMLCKLFLKFDPPTITRVAYNTDGMEQIQNLTLLAVMQFA